MGAPTAACSIDLQSEDDIQKSLKLDFVSQVSSLRLFKSDLSRMKIPLCRLVPMAMVRPTLASDIDKLEMEFVHGYDEGSRVFYVSLTNEIGETGIFSESEKAKWGPNWTSVNDLFNDRLRSHPELMHFVDSKFYICDGNHRQIAWMRYISQKHYNDIEWHFSIDSIILDTKDRIGAAMHVMHEINK